MGRLRVGEDVRQSFTSTLIHSDLWPVALLPTYQMRDQTVLLYMRNHKRSRKKSLTITQIV
jgi:hypothetical protein